MDKLDPYRAKRRFDRTSEPEGGRDTGGERVFVVQKHRARRLHYDLRLQVGEVLKSWAVPQGPSLDPKVRRFAKQTEDHPLDYASFEGVIPKGEYGAGAVIVWDRGRWATPEIDAEAAIARGELKFRLAGEKLTGGFMLKRLKNDPTDWLLIKERDDSARPSSEYDVLKALPNSVLSGWSGEEPPAEPPSPAAAPAGPDPAALQGAKPAPMPETLQPMLATAAAIVPSQEGWLHEIKYDGYRTLAFFREGEVKFLTRNGLDWTKRYGVLAKAFRGLPCREAILDGEVVVQDAKGVTTLDQLERALAEGRTGALTFFAFDLPYLDGHDLSRVVLIERKRALAALLAPILTPTSALHYSEHLETGGQELFAHACRLGLEGVVSKRADSRYVEARSQNWLKVKRTDLATHVVIGFTINAPRCVAALLLAEERDGGLAYVGRVGSGIGDGKARELYALLSPARRDQPVCPVPRIPQASFIEPNWLAEIGHRGLSADGVPRQPALLGLRDRPPPPAPRPQRLKPRLIQDGDLAAIRLTNPEREIFPGSAVTKLDLALYYARVGDWMLPELLNRPLSLIRCPSGAQKDCFYQRHAFHGLPPGVGRIELAEEEGRGAYIYVQEPRGFLGLAQFGAIEFHLWGCRVEDPEHPDRLILDLDPAEGLSWPSICDAAEAVRAKLEALGLAPFLRTTGGKGLHLVMALQPGHDWALVKGFAQAIAQQMAAEAPALFTANMAKRARAGRVYLDYLRNGRGATAIASYSLRARPSFPASAPIGWNELRTLPGGDAFTRENMVNRLESLVSDPWEGLLSSAVRITQSMRRAVGMRG